jgi:hypothetical protein
MCVQLKDGDGWLILKLTKQSGLRVLTCDNFIIIASQSYFHIIRNNPQIGAWKIVSIDEEEQLIRLVEQMGPRWRQIAQLIGNRTGNLET